MLDQQLVECSVPPTSPTAQSSVKVVDGVSIDALQGIPYVNLINAELAGAQGISLMICTVPPGGGCSPHLHLGSETALYLLQGEVTTSFGESLEQEVRMTAGQALYIPPGVPHCARNFGNVPAIAIAARTDASEQERVLLLPHLCERPF